MKRIDELRISPTPWRVNEDGEVECEYISNTIRPNEKRTRVVAQPNFHFDECKADSRFIAAAPKLYERLRQSTNFIEHTIQFVSNKDIKKHLQRIADENKAALAEAAGESEVE